MLHLDDHWIWDFWLVADGPDHHLFYLQAPRSLVDPELRHRRATIGHAVSTDLVTWSVLPDALGPGRAGAWDDVATWTGSVIRRDGRWHLGYTGTSSVEDGLIQRIGFASSDDLVSWERTGADPTISADHRWYERFGDSEWYDEAWRDPWLITDPASGDVLAFICARRPDGPSHERGAIALARSADLDDWTVEPPCYAPGLFAQMEVPQVLEADGRWYLLFCTGHTTYSVIGDSPTGPFDEEPEPVAAPTAEIHYAGKLHRVGDQLMYLASVVHGADGRYVGDLSDPRPVTIEADGRLTVQG